ncbi:MAG TPA: hypothetical protein VG269_23620 [Tepidisphaeraceae bacterium]|jgi:predicted RNA-binding Zn-ribbon protein involved in translation (DUF1610 family)|nr:hypothetical protein [Tepidisphaeraceae bacterium]
MSKRVMLGILGTVSGFVLLVAVGMWRYSWDLNSSHPVSSHAMPFLGLLVMVLVVVIVAGVVIFLNIVDRRSRALFQHRKRMGLCVHCGYDLTGTDGKCPECGKWTVRRAVNSGTENR